MGKFGGCVADIFIIDGFGIERIGRVGKVLRADLFKADAVIVADADFEAFDAGRPNDTIKGIARIRTKTGLGLRARSDGRDDKPKFIRSDLLGFFVVHSPIGIQQSEAKTHFTLI